MIQSELELRRTLGDRRQGDGGYRHGSCRDLTPLDWVSRYQLGETAQWTVIGSSEEERPEVDENARRMTWGRSESRVEVGIL